MRIDCWMAGMAKIREKERASTAELAAIRKLEPSQLVQLALDFGLYERLRERPAG